MHEAVADLPRLAAESDGFRGYLVRLAGANDLLGEAAADVLRHVGSP
jgi:hypothetical protein